jgi:hypothetical protein
LTAWKPHSRAGDWFMHKIRCACFCVLAIAAIGALIWLLFPTGKVIAELEMKNTDGFAYSLKVTSFGERCRTELIFNHKLLVSSYEYYVNSIPPKTATISWPELHKFTVTFDTGDSVHCSWDDYKFDWENSGRPVGR